LDFFAQTPLKKQNQSEGDFEPKIAEFGTVTQEFHIGQGSVATPGVVAGIFEIHKRWGSLPLSRLAEFGIALARDGHAIDPFQAQILDIVEPIMLASEGSRVYFESREKTGAGLQAGEIHQVPELADFIDCLVREGSDLFYRGDIAHTIVKEQQGGGALTLDDLAAFKVIERTPLRVALRDVEFFTNPVPSTGGTLIGFALALLDQVIDGKVDTSDPNWFELLTMVMMATNDMRDVSGFSHDPTTDQQNAILEPDFIATYVRGVKERARKIGGTTHISIADAAGNVAAATLSNGEGCGHMVPGAGFMMNNMLGEEDINPFGFFDWPCNTRISSMMSPSIIRWPDGRMAALGSGVSNRIRTAILQVAIGLIHSHRLPEEAVGAPRIHWERNLLNMEAGLGEKVQTALCKQHPDFKIWPGQDLFFGGVHVAETGPEGARGAADPRRGGVVEFV
jgi:gamma-glutamyltranspeptidase/glutathione hydrolase